MDTKQAQTRTFSIIDRHLPYVFGNSDCRLTSLVKMTENNRVYYGLYSPFLTPTEARTASEKWIKRLKRSEKERRFLRNTDVKSYFEI